jgi:hypothetical protein
MTPQQKESYKNKALQLREKLLAAESLGIPVDAERLEKFQKQVKNFRGRQGCNNNFKSMLRKAGFIAYNKDTKTYYWNQAMDGEFDLIIECAKESREILFKSNQKKKQQDTAHEPMLYESVMREQEQSIITLKLSSAQIDELKKYHQLLTTILNPTNK